MIRAHVDAVKALLAVPNLTVYDGEVPDSPTVPYAVLYADDGHATSPTLARASTWRDWAFQTTSVGASAPQARWVAEKVHSALLDVRPTVAGRVCSPIAHELTRDVQRDDDVTPPLFYAVDRWRFASVPA